MKKTFATVKQVDFSGFERILAVSDLHGEYQGFEKMLEYTGFDEKTALVILGDIIEKGKDSLRLLKRIAQLSECGRVFAVLGNNDELLRLWYGGQLSDTDLLVYMQKNENSVFKDMAMELNMPFETAEDVGKLKIVCTEAFQKELEFVFTIPHIIQSKLGTFVHAGIRPENLREQETEYCVAAEAFSQQGFAFSSPVIVGHWPASNYRSGIIDANIHYNEQANIYSLDGGVSMKRWHQINILTLKNDGSISMSAMDLCRKIRILEAQEESESSLTLIFPKTLLEIREDRGETLLCYIPHLKKEKVFESKRVYFYKQRHYCGDFTTYRPCVQSGEVVSYCGEAGEGIWIKRGGKVGLYYGKYEWIS